MDALQARGGEVARLVDGHNAGQHPHRLQDGAGPADVHTCRACAGPLMVVGMLLHNSTARMVSMLKHNLCHSQQSSQQRRALTERYRGPENFDMTKSI